MAVAAQVALRVRREAQDHPAAVVVVRVPVAHQVAQALVVHRVLREAQDHPAAVVAVRVLVAHQVAPALVARRDLVGAREAVGRAVHQAVLAVHQDLAAAVDQDQADLPVVQVQVAHLVQAEAQAAVVPVRVVQDPAARLVVQALGQAAAVPIHAVVLVTSCGRASLGIRSKSSLPAKIQIHRFKNSVFAHRQTICRPAHSLAKQSIPDAIKELAEHGCQRMPTQSTWTMSSCDTSSRYSRTHR